LSLPNLKRDMKILFRQIASTWLNDIVLSMLSHWRDCFVKWTANPRAEESYRWWWSALVCWFIIQNINMSPNINLLSWSSTALRFISPLSKDDEISLDLRSGLTTSHLPSELIGGRLFYPLTFSVLSPVAPSSTGLSPPFMSRFVKPLSGVSDLTWLLCVLFACFDVEYFVPLAGIFLKMQATNTQWCLIHFSSGIILISWHGNQLIFLSVEYPFNTSCCKSLVRSAFILTLLSILSISYHEGQVGSVSKVTWLCRGTIDMSQYIRYNAIICMCVWRIFACWSR